jgi:hypothetical protein
VQMISSRACLSSCSIHTWTCCLTVPWFHGLQALWVGPGSRAARDKAAFESSFGPFYRVAQIIISTTPDSRSNYTSTTGLPSIVTDANIRLMFDMQYLVDSLKGDNTPLPRARLCHACAVPTQC